MSSTPLDWAAFEAEACDPANHIPFTPVPRLRARRRGWSEERQRLFIFALSRCGSVARAARSVGMTARSAYDLLDAPGGEDFARAWDRAIAEGIERVRADALQRALGGAFVPVFRKGRLVRVEHRRSDALAIALLSGRDRGVDAYRRLAVDRRRYREDMRALDSVRRRFGSGSPEARAEFDRLVDGIEADARARRDSEDRAERAGDGDPDGDGEGIAPGPPACRPSPGPRLRRL